MPTLSVLVSIASLLSLFTQSPNTEVLATSPPPEGQGISEKPYAGLHVTVFARLTAWIPSPMSDPRLTVSCSVSFCCAGDGIHGLVHVKPHSLSNPKTS